MPTPEPLSAKDVLHATTAAMGAVGSGYVEVDIAAQTEGVMALDIGMRIAGDFEAPDRNHFTLAVDSAGISAEIEVIVIGRESYLKDR